MSKTTTAYLVLVGIKPTPDMVVESADDEASAISTATDLSKTNRGLRYSVWAVAQTEILVGTAYRGTFKPTKEGK